MYPQDAAVNYSERNVIAGNRIGEAKQISALEEIRARLAKVQESVLGIGQRLQGVADRASGGIPQTPQAANGVSKPPSLGSVGEIGDFLSNIERELGWAYSQVERIERIA